MAAVLRLTIDAAHPVLKGWDHYWSVMMNFEMAGRGFSIRDVYRESNARIEDVRDFMRRLVASGFIEPIADGQYRIAKRQTSTPSVRRDGTVLEGATRNQAMWNLMRGPVGRSGFAVDDLVHYASTDTAPISRHTAKSYVMRLCEAGYLIRQRPAKPNAATIWKLLPKMNTGPKAPKILRTRIVFDPNTECTVGDAVAEEERS